MRCRRCPGVGICLRKREYSGSGHAGQPEGSADLRADGVPAAKGARGIGVGAAAEGDASDSG